MTTKTSASRNASFDRLGGFDGLEQAVQRLFTRLAADPALQSLLPASGIEDVRWQVQMLLTDRLGGPMAYDGPDPATVRSQAGITPEQVGRIGEHLVAAFGDLSAPPLAVEELRAVLAEFTRSLGIAVAPPAAAGPTVEEIRATLIAQAVADVARAGVADRPLFVLDPELTLIHLNAEAVRGLAAVDTELRRAFRLGATDLPGQSVLRFHPAPSQLQGLLQDTSRLPKEATWCFGRAVWKARLSAVRDGAGQLLGYAIAWRDETESHRAEAVFQRLRSQAEDLPVPIMYPDAAIERWFGNAACEHALQRLASYLPYPVNPLEGVPVELFLPDEGERRALFRDPDRLPYKTQIRMGPETIAILVSPILDQDQHYLGPQITWEIVHFTRPEDRAPTAPRATRPVSAPPPAVPRVAAAPATVAAPAVDTAPATRPDLVLRSEARALEAAAADLQTLVRLLDLVADQTEGRGMPPDDAAVESAETGAAGQAEAAIVSALATVRRAANEATGALMQDTQGFTAQLQQRVRETMQRTQVSADGLGKILIAATALTELRATFGEPASPGSMAEEAGTG